MSWTARILIFGTVLCLSSAACGGGTGPSSGGASFIQLQVNNAHVTLDNVGFTTRDSSVYISGMHSVPDSNFLYILTISASPFTGIGAYPLEYGTAQYASLNVIDTIDGGPVGGNFLDDLDSPGVLQVKSFDASDSTITGSLDAQLVKANDPTNHIHVKGTFRVRPQR